MWAELDRPWQAAFEQAWEAWCHGSVPIGAALTDAGGQVLAVGRSRQFEQETAPGHVAWSKLSHAELNALLQVSAHDYPGIRSCVLYTTVEPCPLCFGALVMSNVRAVRYAARDSWAGSAALNNSSGFIRSKHISVTGPVPELEVFSTALHAAFFLRTVGTEGTLLDVWRRDCPQGVDLAMAWHEAGTLETAARDGTTIGRLMDQASW